jgi:hypothetical protein
MMDYSRAPIQNSNEILTTKAKRFLKPAVKMDALSRKRRRRRTCSGGGSSSHGTILKI